MIQMDEADPVYLISVTRIIEHFDPITTDPWGVGLTLDMVKHCLANPELQVSKQIGGDPRHPMLHAGRIAWLASHGWKDPIDIDVGVPGFDHLMSAWPVSDGNHRLAAASLIQDSVIGVTICGSLDYAAELFGELKTAACIEQKDHSVVAVDW